MNTDDLILENLSLVPSMAKRYLPLMPLEDLIQEGNIGLIHAARRFKPEKGFKFITYALYYIKGFILRAIEDKSRTIRIPQWVQKELSDDALITKKNRNLYQWTKNYMAQRENLSIDDIEWSISDCDENALLELAYSNIMHDRIMEAFEILDLREQMILRHRYDLWDEPNLSFRELGKELGVSFQRAQQIEQEAFSKIRTVLTI